MVTAIGQPVDRVDGVPKVTGRALYATDRRFGRQLYALGVRSTVAAGRIIDIDVSAAGATQGVVAIYTHLNAAAALSWHKTDALLALGAEALGLAALAAAEPDRREGYLPLTSPVVTFAGQWIAVVVAESLEAAREGAGLVRVRYNQAPASVEMGQEDEAWLKPTFFFGADMQVRRGAEPEGAARHASVQALYTTPMQLHHPMEPSATTAIWQEDGVTLFDSTQGTWATRAYVAESLRIPEGKVRVVSAYVGGGFGAKNQIWPHQALAAHIARALERPVCLQLTRADMAVASGHRSATEQQVGLSCDAGGRLTMLRHVSHVPTSMAGGFFEPCGLNSLMLYETDALDVRHRVARKNIPTPTPFRGPGETPGSFALESALDELAHRLQLDPLELRRRTYPRRDGYHDREWSSNNLLECYLRGAEAFGWPEGPIAPRSMRQGHELIGFGVATTAYPAPALTATVRLRLGTRGNVVVETSATDIGTGMYTILAQAVSDELGVTLASIEVRLGDSDFPQAPTAGRSKSTASLLPATRRACIALLERLVALGDQSGASPGSNLPIGEVLARAGLAELVVEGTSAGMRPNQNLSFYSFGAHFVEVRVDEQIGRLRVARIVSVLDCGRIINPKTAASQIRGGVVFGMGMALMERGEFDPVRSRIVNDNLADYAIPVHADVPPIDVIFLDRLDTRFNEFGARGLGEIGVPGTAAAIANAVHCATGRRVRHLPITLDKLL